MLICAEWPEKIDVGTHTSATIIAPGRGVDKNGRLGNYDKVRVVLVLAIARELQQRGLTVTIIWTGGASRRQVATNDMPARSEAAAMYAYAAHYTQDGTLKQLTDPYSITTVENFANSAPKVKTSLVIIVTDTLHYLWGRVQYIARLTLPRHELIFVELPLRKSTRKQWILQIFSAIILRAAMIGVRPGDLAAIMRRQRRLERLFRVRRRMTRPPRT